MSEIAWFSGCQAASHPLSGIACLSAMYFRKDWLKFFQLSGPFLHNSGISRSGNISIFVYHHNQQYYVYYPLLRSIFLCAKPQTLQPSSTVDFTSLSSSWYTSDLCETLPGGSEWLGSPRSASVVAAEVLCPCISGGKHGYWCHDVGWGLKCLARVQNYRDGLRSGPVLLSNSQAGPGRKFPQHRDHIFGPSLYIWEYVGVIYRANGPQPPLQNLMYPTMWAQKLF